MSLFALLVLLTAVSATTYIYYPVAGEVTDGGVYYIGKVGPGHLVRVILNAEEPSRITSVSSPDGISYYFSANRLFIEFNAPREEGNYSVEVLLEKESGLENIFLAFDVERNILDVYSDGSVSIPEGGTGKVRVVVVNRGSGITKVRVYSTFWSKPVEKLLPAHEAVEAEVALSSVVSGEYLESVIVEDLLGGEVYRSPLLVEVYPTLLGRVRTVFLFPEVALPILYPVRILLGVVFWKT